MANPNDIDNYSFRIHFYSRRETSYFDIYMNDGPIGLINGNYYLDAAPHDPNVGECLLQYVPKLNTTIWGFDDDSLPVNTEDYLWYQVNETYVITGDYQPFGGLMIEGQLGCAYLKSAIAPYRDHQWTTESPRNVALGYTPRISGWTTWETP